MRPLRVLAIYRHYWPDRTPYALILRMILERLSERGAQVAVYTGQPSYNGAGQRQPWVEHRRGVDIRRVALLPESRRWAVLRIVNAVYYLLRAITYAVFFRRFDVIIANAHPPIAIGVCLRIIQGLTGAKTILHLQDIHPESAQAVRRGSSGIFYRTARAVDTGNCRRADHLVTLSSDMRRSLADRGLCLHNLSIINNCPLPSDEPAKGPLPWCITDDSATRLLFAGNLGRFQCLEMLVAAAMKLEASHPWRLIFMGAGVLSGELRQAAGPLIDKNIYFIERQPVAVARAAMRICDYGIVSLSPCVCRYAFPSKSITYLAEGTPIAAIVEPDSDLAQQIRHHRLGISADNGSLSAVVGLLENAIERRGDWTTSERRRIALVADRLYGPGRMLDAWGRVIECVAPGSLKPRSHSAAA